MQDKELVNKLTEIETWVYDNDLALDFSKKTSGHNYACWMRKNELIAWSVSYSSNTDKRQLILTHTHAGVKSIYDRLKRFGVSQKSFLR